MKRPSFPTHCEVRHRLAPVDPFEIRNDPHEPLITDGASRWLESTGVYADEFNDEASFRLVTCACKHCGGMYTFTEDV